MKMTIDVIKEPVKGSVLICVGKDRYEPVAKEVFLNDVFKLKKQVEDLQKEVKRLKVEIRYDRGELSKEELDNELGSN